jgi:hypothetical protein
MIVIQGVHCDMSMYTSIAPQFGSFPPCSPSSPLPFLRCLGQVSVFHVHTCTDCTLAIFTLGWPFSCPASFSLARHYVLVILDVLSTVLVSCDSIHCALAVLQTSISCLFIHNL